MKKIYLVPLLFIFFLLLLGVGSGYAAENCGGGTCPDGTPYTTLCDPSCDAVPRTCWDVPTCVVWNCTLQNGTGSSIACPPGQCPDYTPHCGQPGCGEVKCNCGTGGCYSDCSGCPAPTATPTPTPGLRPCGAWCDYNSQCETGYCLSPPDGFCRNWACPYDWDCVCPPPSTPTPTPTPPLIKPNLDVYNLSASSLTNGTLRAGISNWSTTSAGSSHTGFWIDNVYKGKTWTPALGSNDTVTIDLLSPYTCSGIDDLIEACADVDDEVDESDEYNCWSERWDCPVPTSTPTPYPTSTPTPYPTSTPTPYPTSTPTPTPAPDCPFCPNWVSLTDVLRGDENYNKYIEWENVANEEGYYINRCFNSGCAPGYLTSVGTDVASYTDTNSNDGFSPGTTVVYDISPYKTGCQYVSGGVCSDYANTFPGPAATPTPTPTAGPTATPTPAPTPVSSCDELCKSQGYLSGECRFCYENCSSINPCLGAFPGVPDWVNIGQDNCSSIARCCCELALTPTPTSGPTATPTPTSSPTSTPTPSPTPIPGFPDLRIIDIWPNNWPDPTRVNYQIINSGTEIAGGSTSGIWTDSVYRGSKGVSALNSGQQSEEYLDYFQSCSGLGDTVEVCADINNNVIESNEDNNCRPEYWLCPASSTPTPTPMDTPTPTPTPELGSISGRVFDSSQAGTTCLNLDSRPALEGATVTADKLGDGEDTRISQPDGSYSFDDISGTFLVSASKDNYDQNLVCEGTSPSGSSLTVPPDHTNVNFGLSTTSEPWFQTEGGDVHANNGIFSEIPQSTCDLDPVCQSHFSLAFEATENFNGLVTSGDGIDMGTGDVGEKKDWSDTGESIYLSGYNYAYFNALIEQDDGSHDLSIGKPGAGGGVKVYRNSGDQVLSGSWTINSGEKFIFLIGSKLTIETDITVDPGGFIFFIVNGEIEITDLVNNLHGIYVANTLTTSGQTDNFFNGEGMFIGLGDVSLNRTFATIDLNETKPVETFTYRPDLPMNAPDFFRKADYTWQEVAP